jgi:hypothetical protein
MTGVGGSWSQVVAVGRGDEYLDDLAELDRRYKKRQRPPTFTRAAGSHADRLAARRRSARMQQRPYSCGSRSCTARRI